MKEIYKYVVPERIDILENLKIRFTQPKYLNDPFDMFLSFKTLVDEKEFRSKFDAQKLYNLFYENFEKKLSERKVQIESIYQKEWDKIVFASINVMADLLTSDSSIMKNLFYDEMNKLVGILSLTESPDNIPMWSHYANIHQGFVIIFDVDNTFFNRSITNDKDFGVLTKVNYDENKIIIETLKEISGEPFYQKHTSWKYEKEWRMILPLEKCKNIGNDIYLADFPPELISGIILGYRSSEELLSKLIKIKNQKLSHIKLFIATPDQYEYKMNISVLDK